MPNAKLIPMPSIWGHFAGGPGTNPEDVKFLDKYVKELLSKPEAWILKRAGSEGVGTG